MSKTLEILLMDLGGTGSRAVYRDSSGAVRTSEGGGANPYRLGAEKVEAVLLQHLSDLGLSNQNLNISRVIVGMAGVSSPISSHTVSTAFQKADITAQIELISDAELTHRAAYGIGVDANGGAAAAVSKTAIEILLIAGTGSIAVSISPVDGKLVRAGGLGHDRGDEGSGNWIGGKIKDIALADPSFANCDVLRACVRTHSAGAGGDASEGEGEGEGSLEATPSASLATTLDDLAATFPAAADLADLAGRELAAIVQSVYDQQRAFYHVRSPDADLTGIAGSVRCYGSVLKHSKSVRKAFREALQAPISDCGDVSDVLQELLQVL